jgi:hypothetical protein
MLDLESLTQAMGRHLREAERAGLLAIQHQAQRWTFLGSGMSHRNFLATLQDAARHQVEQAAATFS